MEDLSLTRGGIPVKFANVVKFELFAQVLQQ
jgi:hypothetical protein